MFNYKIAYLYSQYSIMILSNRHYSFNSLITLVLYIVE